MAPPPTTRSSPAPSSDSVLQLINDRLSAITQELGDIRREFTQDLTDIRKNITDLKQTVTGFQKELPHRFESIQDQQNTFQTDTNIRLDTLTMKLADTAVEFSEFQHNVETKIQELHDDPMTFTPCIINTVNAVLENKIDNMIETKFQDLPALVTKELQKSPSSLLHPVIDTSPAVTKLIRNVQDLQLIPRHTNIIPRLSGFHQLESKDFHVSRLLKLLDTVTLASDSLQDLETFHDTIQSHFFYCDHI